jgi:predicted dehydrogenase
VIRVGIIGCGRIADLHAAAYLSHPRATITAVCDPDEESRRVRGDAWGVPPDAQVSDYRELLARDDVDMVEVLVPHHLHLPVALAAMDAGKHVSLQKPMALDLDEADQMIERAAESAVAFKVFENFVFYAPIQRAKDLIDAGAIGDVLSIRLKSHTGWSPDAWQVTPETLAWRFDREKCGGGPMVFDDGHHKFSIAWYLLGVPDQVHAFIGSSFGGALDAPSLVSWTYADGAVGNLEVAFSTDLQIKTAHYAQDDRVEITGSKGVIWVTRGHGQMTDEPPVQLYRDGRLTGFSDMPVGWETSFVRSGHHFVDALLDGGEPFLTGAQGREVLAFALAAQRSSTLASVVSYSG